MHPRRVMAYMLIVATGELSDPVVLVVSVIADDSLLHQCALVVAGERFSRLAERA